MATAKRKPVLLIIRGLPGVGKSTLAQRLYDNGVGDFVSLNPDRVHLEELKTQQLLLDPDEVVSRQTLKYRFLLHQAKMQMLDGRDVIWDQPWRSLWGIRVTRDKVQTFLANHGGKDQRSFRLVIIELRLNEDETRGRLQQRKSQGKHGPSEKTFQRFVREFEAASSEEFEVFHLDAQSTPEELARQVEFLL